MPPGDLIPYSSGGAEACGAYGGGGSGLFSLEKGAGAWAGASAVSGSLVSAKAVGITPSCVCSYDIRCHFANIKDR